jgi:sulfate transport system substrate-binding protein
MRPFILLAVVIGFAMGQVSQAAEQVQLTLVSYAVAKPVFAKIIPAFTQQYKAQTGQDVKFTESYGASGAQSRAIVGGLEADVLATNLQANVDILVEAGLVKSGWAERLPNRASPASSVISVIVRKGNPKNIKTWQDLAKDGVEIVAINPKTSGNARWGVLAGYAAILKTQDEAAADAYVRGLVRNTKTLVAGGREATDAFLKNRIGDALLTFENEARFANKVSKLGLEYVAPDPNIRTDFPVTVVDKVVDKRGTRQAAEAFAKFLFSEQAQTIYGELGYRPFDEKTAAKFAGEVEKVSKILTIDDVGGWTTIDKKLFADGALYDQAQARK